MTEVKKPNLDPIKAEAEKKRYEDVITEVKYKGISLDEQTIWCLDSVKTDMSWNVKTKKRDIPMLKYTFSLIHPLPKTTVYKNENYLYLNIPIEYDENGVPKNIPQFSWNHNNKTTNEYLDKNFLQHAFCINGVCELSVVEFNEPYITQKKESFKKGDVINRFLMSADSFINVSHQEVQTSKAWVPGAILSPSEQTNNSRVFSIVYQVIKSLTDNDSGIPADSDSILELVKKKVNTIDIVQLADIFEQMLNDKDPLIAEVAPGKFITTI